VSFLRSVSLTGSQPRGRLAPGLAAENGAGSGAASMLGQTTERERR
jgi:hypothetical protein